MLRKKRKPSTLLLAATTIVFIFTPVSLNAHCDTMNGPVVIAAQKALETNNINLVLVWVQKQDEALIRDAFTKTIAVRKLSPDAKKLADMYFFETVVRIHRAGEGVAYTGLKPAEVAVEPGIEAADRALQKGSAKELVGHLTEAVHQGIHQRFTAAMALKNYTMDDVTEGREYVKAYVVFIHYVERLYQAAERSAEGHGHGAESEAGHDSH